MSQTTHHNYKITSNKKNYEINLNWAGSSKIRCHFIPKKCTRYTLMNFFTSDSLNFIIQNEYYQMKKNIIFNCINLFLGMKLIPVAPYLKFTFISFLIHQINASNIYCIPHYSFVFKINMCLYVYTIILIIGKILNGTVYR